MKILVLAPFPYGSSSGQGGAAACLSALKALAERNEVIVLCFASNSASDQSALQEMSEYCKSVLSVPLKIDRLQVALAKLRSLISFVPEHAVYFDSKEFREKMDGIKESFFPDLIITQFPQMGQYLCGNAATPRIHDVQDAFSVSWYRRAQSARPGLSKLYAYKQWMNWVRYESVCYEQADECWTLSEQDCFGLKVFSPHLQVISVGLPFFSKRTVNSAIQADAVGFIGSFGHPPNCEALDYLLSEVVPRVLAKRPKTQFVVAGREPPEWALRKGGEAVSFIGFVPTLADFYDRCGVVVAPLLSGGGVKIKVAEALCFGRALVTTPIGAEGLPIVDGVHAFVRSDTEGFSDAVVTLLESPILRSEISAAGHRLASEALSVDSWTDLVEKRMNDIARRRSVAMND